MHDYRSEDYLRDTDDGSATLGFGFYTTDNKDEASNYSFVRQGRNVQAHLIVTPILPYQARVLDLRNRDNLLRNAPVSKEFAIKWRGRFWSYLETRQPREGNVGLILNAAEGDYLKHLGEIINLDEIDLRELLGTAHSPRTRNSVYMPSPPWAYLFSDFMREEGYDGLVYNEGGEGHQAKGGTSYVFYNLDTIGTYESWRERDT